MARFDWPALMAVGLRDLRLPPETFWALTPAELAIMAGLGGQGGPMGRAQLDALMARFPDPAKGDGDG